jgi:hypothetical protein
MPIKTTGSLSLSEIQDEFGGVAPTSLGEYRQGGAYVPTGTVNKDGGQTPGATGAISMAAFYGAAAIPSSLAINMFLVGGGGGGGVRYGWDNAQFNGGGGAGGVVNKNISITRGSYAITIGAGGSFERTLDRDLSSGGNSTAFGYTAYGGGHGGGSDGRPGVGGGSGGGGPGGGGPGVYPGSTFVNAERQGYDGYWGGGGAGFASTGHDGGDGVPYISEYYAGGGGSSSSTKGSRGGGGYTDGYVQQVIGGYDYYGNPWYTYQWVGNRQYGGNHATFWGGGGQGGATKFGGADYGYYGGNGYQGILWITYRWEFQLLSGLGDVITQTLSGETKKRFFHKITSSGTIVY